MKLRNEGGIYLGAFLVLVGAILCVAPLNISIRHYSTIWNIAREWISSLESLFWTIGPSSSSSSIRISVLDLAGSIFVCREYRRWVREERISKSEKCPSILECFISCTLLQFGGTTVTALFLGTVPSWTVSYSAFNALIVAWLLVFCLPGDAFFLFFTRGSVAAKYTDHCLSALRLVSAGHAISSWGVDKALSCQFHVNESRVALSFWTCLLCGVFSGGGGGILADWLKIRGTFPSYAPNGTTVGIFESNASIRSRAQVAPARALVLSFLYLFLTNESGWFDLIGLKSWKRNDAKVVVCTLMLLQHEIAKSWMPEFLSEAGYPRILSWMARNIGAYDFERRCKMF
jgi:hypothetical protein